MMPDDQTTLDLSQRDAVLQKHQQKALVRYLEYRVWYDGSWIDTKGTGEFAPVSVNDARRILTEEGITAPDLRCLGALFPPSRWIGVGWTKSIGEYRSGKHHGRKVQTFRPKDGVVIPKVERPNV